MIIHSCYYMKKLSSSSSSPSCNNSNHVLPKGCLFSRILRRILCFNVLPWRPFDHHHHQQQQQQKRPLLIKDCQELGEKDCNLVMETAVSDPIVAPGLVARLMGLESLPDESKDSAPLKVCKGRKEITMYQELEEDDEFYTLRFGDRKKQRRRRRRRRVGENKENEGVSAAIRGSKSKGDSRIALAVLMNQKNGCEKDEIGVNQRSEVVNCSENSSPNSVLEFPPDQTADTCTGDNCRVGNLKMRRTLSDELESCRNPDDDDDDDEKMKKKRDIERSENSLIRRTGKLAMAAMEIEMGIGRRRRRWEEEEDEEINVKEIGGDVASHILDHLLNEFLIMLD